LIQRDKLPKNCLRNAMIVQEEEIEYYAARLKSRELEGLLLDLNSTKNMDEINRAVKIITLRNSQRIIKLISILSQYYYDSLSLNILCKRITENCTKKQLKENSYLHKIGMKDNKIVAFMQAISQEGQDMTVTCEKYGVSEKSPLAMEGFLAYFNKCDKTAFLINYKKMIILIEELPIQKIFEMLANYLNVFNLIEYIESVNLAILDKLEQPYVSVEWKPFSVELREKFAHWSYLYRLKIHCEENPEKLNALIKYFEYVRTSYEINEGEILIIDFGWVVLANVKGSMDSYLYDKRLFEKEMSQWEQDIEIVPSFLDGIKDIMTARHFMLTEDDSRCIKLTLEDIHYYYAQEVLDIKLGLEPDMRNHDVK